jgi:hypothetical protein
MKEQFEAVATRQEGSSGNDFVDTILNERRKLRGHMAYLPYDGVMSHTARIDGVYYKGAREGRTTDADIDFERRFIEHMGARGVPYLPRVVYVGQQAVFFGTEPVPGVAFEGTVLVTDTRGPFVEGYHALVESAEIKNIARGLAGFVVSMARAFTHEEATKEFGLKPKLPDLEQVEQAMQKADVRTALGAQLPACQRLVNEYIEAFSQKKPIVMHTDLNLGNCFVDPETKTLSGVLDFGMVKYYVPETDSSNRIFEHYPEDFVKAFCDECEAQGLSISYRHRNLFQFAGAIKRLQGVIEKEYSPDFTLKDIAGYIDQLDGRAASVSPPAVSRLRPSL